jgi:hypothetical protein
MQQRYLIRLILFLASLSSLEVASSQSAPELRRAVVDRRIGGPGKETDAFIFGDVRGLWIDGGGRVFVADASDHTVRVFGADGEIQATLGRVGGGPGEFNQPCCLGIGPDGLLWVKDFGNRRYNAFTVTGTAPAYATTTRSGSNPIGFLDRVAWTADGSIIDVQSVIQAAGERLRFIRSALDRDGTATPLDTVEGPDPRELREFVTRRGGGSSVFPQPFGPRPLLAFGADGRAAIANSAVYAVNLLGTGGRPRRVIARDVGSGPALSERERSSANRTLDGVASRNGISRGSLPFDVPDGKPVLASLGFDQDGRLWVRRSTAEGAENVADLYGRDGAFLAEVRWPANVRLSLHSATGWVVVGIETQADETINLAVLQMVPVPR